MSVLSFLAEPSFILLVLAGCVAGLLVGALPGLSVTMATALLVSVTYAWRTNDAIALIMGVYVIGVFSGALSAILLNIPGAPSSVITTLDGHPMARKGEGARAIRIAAVWSFFGSVVGFAFLAALARPVTALALAFKPMDYFLLSLFGLLSIGILTAKDSARGWISAVIGLLLSLVGMDSVAGYPRLTFGIRALRSGIGIVPALIGLFGFARVLSLLREEIGARRGKAESVADTDVAATQTAERAQTDVTTDGEKTQKTNEAEQTESGKSTGGLIRGWRTGLPSALVGTAVGALPGAGTPVASLVAYGLAKRFVKAPSAPFGEGAEEGIAASEAANNAVVGGALIPTLTLGIPGDAVTAILLAVFTLHGLEPGPLFLERSPDAFRAILAAGLLACVFLLPIGLWIGPRTARILKIPRAVLIPLVAVLCLVGAYGTEKRLSDVVLMVLLGAFGYLLERRGFPTAPVTLGLVLGNLMDANFRRALSLASSADSPLLALFGRPITLILLAAIAILLIRQSCNSKKRPSERTMK